MYGNQITEGYAYHIKSEYFSLVSDRKLMQNEKDNSRPAYYCVKDSKYPKILWMIPLSSKLQKYKVLYEKQIEKYGECIRVMIAVFGKTESVFLLQNSFPITEEYISHIHKEGEMPVRLDIKTQRELALKFAKLQHLRSKGFNFVLTDVDRIMGILLAMSQHQRANDETVAGKEVTEDSEKSKLREKA